MTSNSSNIIHILVVDDERALRHVLRDILKQKGYTVTTASNAEVAASLLCHSRYDVVISDWQMPGMLGDALISRIKKNDPGILTVLMSSDPDVESAAQAVGATAFFWKCNPIFTLPEVIARVIAESGTV